MDGHQLLRIQDRSHYAFTESEVAALVDSYTHVECVRAAAKGYGAAIVRYGDLARDIPEHLLYAAVANKRRDLERTQLVVLMRDNSSLEIYWSEDDSPRQSETIKA